MPFINRYSDVKKGGIVFAGNTLGLSKATNQNAPGTEGSIGAFTSLDNTLQVGAFPVGTTLDYTENGSNATVDIPADSSVLYAELVWGGLYSSSENNISNLINNNVTFNTPSGSHSIAPDATTAQTFSIPADDITVGFYVRSADVTAFVQTGGVYSVQSVPALIEAIDARTSDTNHAGWTLAVVYENPSSPLRNLTFWCGGTVVSPNTGSTTINVTDFITPEVLPISGKIFVSAQEGDAVLTNDRMLFGQDEASLAELSGPNNPQTNFFASQINDSNGLLDTRGTFGNRNANAASGTNTSACRQGWDITAIDVSDQLAANQTSAVIRFTTDGDLYVPNALALQVDSKGANLNVNKSADKTIADVGEEITYTLTLKNTGSMSALNVVINDLLPPDTVLVENSITVNGAPYAGGLPVTIDEIAAESEAVVTFKVTANSVPAQNPVVNVARADYEFFPFPERPANESADSNPVSVYIVLREVSNVKSVDKGLAVKGDVLTYTSVITNEGNVPVNNVTFTDAIPAGTQFVNSSVYIDGVNQPAYNPQSGFFAANLMPQESVTITFQVTII